MFFYPQVFFEFILERLKQFEAIFEAQNFLSKIQGNPPNITWEALIFICVCTTATVIHGHLAWVSLANLRGSLKDPRGFTSQKPGSSSRCWFVNGFPVSRFENRTFNKKLPVAVWLCRLERESRKWDELGTWKMVSLKHLICWVCFVILYDFLIFESFLNSLNTFQLAHGSQP